MSYEEEDTCMSYEGSCKSSAALVVREIEKREINSFAAPV
jgi:hypothetical protein